MIIESSDCLIRLCTISKNAENLFMKSVVSDTLQCCRICLSRCMEFGNAHKSRFECEWELIYTK